jgi:membrane-bound lytic murein transglycosylase B
MLGLAALAVTTSSSAAGIGTTQPERAAELVRSADAPVVAQLSAAETTARPTPEVPALEIGATPLGARRPVELDGRRATVTGTLPGTAAYAYTFASSALEEAEPNCGLRWSLLAAIGRIESNHGRAGEARLDDQGVVTPVVRGARLDGSRGTSAVRDTDAGDLDGNRRFDRAVGPMQLLPSTWGVVGVDADGDGKRNPDDIDDAALGAAVLLCGAPGRLTTDAGLTEALERYNTAPGYAAAAARLERQYRRSGVPVATLGGSATAPGIAPPTPSATLEALITGDDEDVDELDLPTLRAGSGDGTAKGGDRNDDSRHDDGRNGGPAHDGGKDDGKKDGNGGDQPTDPPSGPTNPPSGPTDPPSEPTDPPSGPTDPPSEPTDPPSGPTDPPSEPTDPPSEPTEPTDPPSEPSEPTEPTDPPSEPSEPTEPTDPPSEPSEPTEPPSEPTEPPAPVCSDTPAGAAPPSQPRSAVAPTTGALSCDAGGWSVGGRAVSVGDAAWLSTPALASFDGDAVLESNLEELRGLVGTTVTAGLDDAGTLWTLQGQPYLPAPAPTPTRTPNGSPSATSGS